MCAAWQTEHQEITNLFNLANMSAEITKTFSNFFIAYVHFASTFPLPLHIFIHFKGTLLSPLGA